ELLQGIFRAAHTLKGSSATLGHHRMAQLTHGMENILDKVRKGQLEITTSIMDVLLEALDVLKVLKEEIETLEESDVDLETILTGLAEAAEDQGLPVAKSAATELKAAQGPETDMEPKPATTALAMPDLALDWEEKNMVLEAIKEGKQAFNVLVRLDQASDMLPVRALLTLMALREVGEIVKSLPSSEEIEREEAKPLLALLLLTASDRETVLRAVRELPDILSVEAEILDAERELEDNNFKQPVPADNEQSEPSKRQPEKSNSTGKVKDTRITKAGRTVRVDVELLDNLMNLVGELVIDKTRLAQIVGSLETKVENNEYSEDLARTSIHIGRVTTMLQEEIMKARMIPVESLFTKFPRMMRDLSQKAGKEIEFIMEGQETELDRSIIEEIGDPLIHLLRNAVDHAVEPPDERKTVGKSPTGHVILSARHEENHIIISVADDGRGIDPEKIKASAIRKGLVTEEAARRLSETEAVNLIFASGFSTAAKVTDVSGRGVGMDVVRNNLEKVNGSVEIQTKVGVGTTFLIKLPLTLAIIRALMVSVDRRVYSIPLTSVTETIRITSDQIQDVNKREVIVVRGRVLPLLRVKELFNHQQEGMGNPDKICVVVVNLGGQEMGMVVDSLIGEQEVVIKSLGKFIGDVQGIAGATILGDGSVALIVDVPSMIKKVGTVS
ncbi:MAG TPA: chemotaxis protein CheA, partial [Bacillota bacterium]|nr:chemotaxis protein CheA [Bacillota bacterium]